MKYRMKRLLSIFLVLTMLCTWCAPVTPSAVSETGTVIMDNGDGSFGISEVTEDPFEDVNRTQFFYESVLWAVGAGITNGIDETHFGPFLTTNRAAVVTMLWRYAGSPTPITTTNPFADVPEGSFYYDAVLWAVEKGITNGLTADTFGPTANCNRAQVVTFLWRYMGQPQSGNTEHPFNDLPEDSFYEQAVLWALSNGITTGATATTFNPAGECLRAQFVTFLYRTSQLHVCYTVTFECTGGSSVALAEVKAGALAERPEDPVRDGWVFAGWYSDAELTAVYDFTAPVICDITLYARWEVPYLQITLNPGSYGNHVVNRTVTGSVTGNVPAARITYELTGAYNTITGEIDPAAAADFCVDVLLQDGENVLKVNVQGTNGIAVSECVTLNYDSGYVYATGERAEEISERLILIPAWYGQDTTEEPVGQIASNVLNLYFHDEVDFEDRCSFCTEILGGEVVGYLNALDMMQVLLPDQLPNAGAVGYNGETDLTKITEAELYAYLDALTAAHGDVLESIEPEYMLELGEQTVTSNDPWNNRNDDDWWLDIIDAYGAWEYDDHYNSDFLRDTKIAMLDTGVHWTHPDLKGHVLRSTLGKDHTVYDHHGTYVAGVMVAEADNREGIVGVMHNNGLLLDYMPSIVTSSTVKGCLVKAVERNAKVFNLSQGWAFQIMPGKSSGSVQEWNVSNTMGQLLERGFDFIVVQSAGNGNAANQGVDYWYNQCFSAVNSRNCYSSEKVSKQDIMDRILIVAAIDQTDDLDKAHLTSFSNGDSGGGELHIIAAPGANVLTTHTGLPVTIDGVTYPDWNDYYTTGPKPNPNKVTLDPHYTYQSGTSLSAPIVAGVCALTWSANEELTGAEVVKMVMKTAEATAGNPIAVSGNDILSFTKGGMPIVNAENAVVAAVNSRPDYILRITDQATGAGIRASATVHLDSLNGPVVGEKVAYHSDTNGVLKLPKLPSEFYCIEIIADGYEPYVYEVYFQESKLDSLTYDVKLNRRPGQPGDGEEGRKEMYSGTCGSNAQWMLYDDGLLQITGTGSMSNYSGGSAPWYPYRYQVRRIILDDGITQIGNYAFWNLRTLESVEFPKNLDTVGRYAFQYCTALESADLQDNVKVIDRMGFQGCTGLVSIDIPNGLTTIGDWAFSGCTELRSIYLPPSLTKLGQGALETCHKLTTVTIPPNIQTVEDWLLHDATGLKEIVLHAGIKVIDYEAFYGCTRLKRIVFEGNAPSISSSAFYLVTADAYYPEWNSSWGESIRGSYSGNLTWKSYSDSAPDDPITDTSAVPAVFESGTCNTGLTWQTTYEDIVTISGSGAIPDYSEVYAPWYHHRYSVKTVEIGDGVTRIGNRAFWGCPALTYISVPESVSSIGSSAFFDCSRLNSITLTGAVERIGANAFSGCTQLEYFIAEDALDLIESGAFANCSNLRSIIFSGDAPAFGTDVFKGDNATAYYPADNPTWTPDVMQNYGGLITWVAY